MCRYLITEWLRFPDGTGGYQPGCHLNRERFWDIGSLRDCQTTPHAGPCWVWKDLMGARPDAEFQRGR